MKTIINNALRRVISWLQPSKSTVQPEAQTAFRFQSVADQTMDGESTIEQNSRRLISEKERSFWEMGNHDGQLGLSKEKATPQARLSAELVTLEIVAEFVGQVNKHKVDLEIRENAFALHKTEHDKVHHYLAGLKEAYQKDPRKFSLFLGLVYLFFAVFLILADIPLALQLTLEGFNLEESGSISDSLFFYPLLIFAMNWEVFLLSIGIAFCTIYIKIYWDEYMACPMEHKVTQFKDLYKIEAGEEKQVKQVARRRFWVKTLVLGFTLLTILILGVFRYQTKMVVLEEELPTMGLYLFIAITLLFPIIGGICASLGLNHFGNYRDLRQAQKMARDAESMLEAASRRRQVACSALAKWISKFDATNADSFVGNLRLLFASQYERGYQCGWLTPASVTSNSDSLHEMSRMARSKLVARGILEMQLNQKRASIGLDAVNHMESNQNGRAVEHD